MDDSTITQTGDEAPSTPTPSATDVADGATKLGCRAARTRAAILEASKKLFLERGYAGTRIHNITDACGISRAGFYTYFKDKKEIFNALGEQTYREILAVVEAWEQTPRPCSRADVEAWVWEYFAFLDEHGAFVLSAQSRPADEVTGAASSRMQMRVAWLLGVHLRGRQRTPTDAPEALGLAVQSMMDRAWYHTHVQRLPVDNADLVRVIADFIMAILQA
ncbi:MAG: TetR/AcrR family transcriptional regulator [Frankia sp.]|nr:TetR/AcrR family transcriptional regulator [Frankia sp.]